MKIQDDSFRYGRWSLCILEAKSGKRILNINEQKNMIPASVLKVITTAAAITFFGPHHRFTTSLSYDGALRKEGSIEGNLYIVGGGDPTLGSDGIPSTLSFTELFAAWHKALYEKGIKLINGKIVSDDCYFTASPTPDDWQWSDIGNYYGASVHGLNIHDNLYHLYFQPSTRIGGQARILRIFPFIPGLTFINKMKTGPSNSGDRGFIYGGYRQFEKELRGTIPAGKNDFSIKGSIPNPPLVAAKTLKRYLLENDIMVTGEAEVLRNCVNYGNKKRIHLSVIKSPPLKDIIFLINKRSINLYAEVLLRHLIKAKYGFENSQKAQMTLKTFLKESMIDTDGVFITDGSGLSRTNYISAESIALTLKSMYHSPYFKEYYHSLPLAGDPQETGSMRNMCKGTKAEKNLRAKTGSMKRVRSYAGYVYTTSGKLLCFAMIGNNFIGPSSHVKALHEQIMIKMAELP